MAKGQMRSNKEVKKPKADKVKAAAGSDLLGRVGQAQEAKEKAKAAKK